MKVETNNNARAQGECIIESRPSFPHPSVKLNNINYG